MNCSIKNSSIVDDVDYSSFQVEFLGPRVSKGLLTRFIIRAECTALDSSDSRHIQPLVLDFLKLGVALEAECGRYEYILNGLQSYSKCTVFIAAATKVGAGPSVTCSAFTPFIG